MKRLRKVRSGFFVFSLMLVMAALLPVMPAEAKSKGQVKSVTVSPKNVTVTAGKSQKAAVKIKYKKKGSVKVTVKSSKSSVATAKYNSGKVTITGKKAGKATVTVTVKGTNTKKAAIRVTVKAKSTTPSTPSTPSTPTTPSEGTTPQTPVTPSPVLAEELTLSKTALTLEAGASGTLTATITPADTTDQTVTWTSSDPSVASVNNGVVTAIKPGASTITASNAASGRSAACSVTVTGSIAVNTQDELNQALTAGYYSAITIGQGAAGALTIPAGNYASTLEIAGSAANVTNAGGFASVSVAGGTYTDTCGNQILVTGAANLVLPAGGTSKVAVNIPNGSKAQKVTITNSGGLGSLAALSGASIQISGSSVMPVSVTISADNVKFVTTQAIRLRATNTAELHFLKPLTGFVLSVDTKAHKPSIAGLGDSYTVTYDDGSSETVTPADSDEVVPVQLSGKVTDAVKGSALEGVKVVITPKKATAKVTEREMVTDASGAYTFADVAGAEYTVTFTKDGYKEAKQYVVAAEDLTLEDMALIPSDGTDSKNASISGRITNASSPDTGISDLTVELREGKGFTSGTAKKTTKTDSSGNYTFSGLEAGQYTVYALDQRTGDGLKFIAGSADVTVTPGQNAKDQNILLSSVIENGVRFVLTWGTEADGAPADMDSYLFGPGVDDGKFVVYYEAREYGLVNYSVCLDVDDTDYEGPETTSVLKPNDEGIYDFYVYRLSDAGSWKTSKARVNVYSGSELLQTYYVPAVETEERWWKVCSYDAATNKLTDHNTILETDELIEGLNDENTYKQGVSDLIKKVTSSKDSGLENNSYISSSSFNTETYSETRAAIHLSSDMEWSEIESSLKYEGLQSGDTTKLAYAVNLTTNKVGVLSVSRSGKVIAQYDVFYDSGNGLEKLAQKYGTEDDSKKSDGDEGNDSKKDDSDEGDDSKKGDSDEGDDSKKSDSDDGDDSKKGDDDTDNKDDDDEDGQTVGLLKKAVDISGSFTLKTLDDESITKASLEDSEKPTILIIGKTECTNCEKLMESLERSEVYDVAKVLFAIVPNSKTDAQAYASKYAEDVIYCYQGGSNALSAIYGSLYEEENHTYSTPIVVILDKEGKIRYYAEGITEISVVEYALSDIEKQDDGNSSDDSNDDASESGKDGDIKIVRYFGEASESEYTIDLEYGFLWLKALYKSSTDYSDDGVDVTWSSSNESIAVIDDEGWVDPKSKGTVTITATTKDGKYSASVKVTVTDEEDD